MPSGTVILLALANVLLAGNVYYLQVITRELKEWRRAKGGV